MREAVAVIGFIGLVIVVDVVALAVWTVRLL